MDSDCPTGIIGLILMTDTGDLAKMSGRKNSKVSRTGMAVLLAILIVVGHFNMVLPVYAEDLGKVKSSSQYGENTLPEEDRGESNVGDDSSIEENINEESDGESAESTEKPGIEDTEGDSVSENATEEENTDKESGEENTEALGEPQGEEAEKESDEESENTEAEDAGEDSIIEDAAENDTDKESGEGSIEEEESIEDKSELAFSEMPDSYCLSREQQEEKSLLSENISDIEEKDEGIRYVERQIMTMADSPEEAEMIAEAYRASIVSFVDGLLVMALEDEEVSVCDALRAAASARTTLPAVWPNYYRYAYGEASEVYADALSVYNDPDLVADSDQYQWQHVAVGSPYAWQQGYTGDGIKVAVIDSGISPHADLVIRDNSDKSNSGSAEDGLGHGTHVAGIIGALADNGIGGAGIAPDCELYNIRVLMSNGSGTDDMIWHGMNQAIEWDVDIVNMSLGGPGYNGLLQDKATEAYEKGIALFVAAGNDGVSCINYPACLDNVICVAATDTNSGRAEFSTYGAWVDLSAPGVNIWSTYRNGGYKAESGTSMACPVAAGEAALLLSSHASLKSAEKGPRRVDQLEELMKSNSTKVSGSGMGTGITSLSKAFNLSTMAVKPQAPTITIFPDEEEQRAQVVITSQAGLKIYYTLNGKNPSFKNGEPAVASGTMLYDFDENRPLLIDDSARITVKAITVNESGAPSAVKTASYTLKPYVTDITVSGVQRILQGKSVQLSAAVVPVYAANKKVSWALQKKDGTPIDAKLASTLGIKISGSGKVTAAEDAKTGSYLVTVTAQDDGKKQVHYEIEIIDKYRVKSVNFSKRSLSLVRPKETTCNLTQFLEMEAVSEGIELSATDFKWTSSDHKIASVDQTGVVTTYKAGKVTIKAVADDSSGRRASCTLKVTQLAQTINISCPSIAGGDQEIPALAVGRSAAFKAEVTPSFTTNKKVTWELYKDGVKIDSRVDADFARRIGVSISSGGRMTASKNAQAGIYTVRAVAKDQSGTVSDALTVAVTDGRINKLTFADKADAKVSIFRKKSVSTTPTEKKIIIEIGTEGVADLNAIKVTNSNPGIAMVNYSREDKYITLTVVATGKATGKTKITVSSTDGSGKKVNCNVTVKNPVSKIHIASNTITSRAYKVNMCIVRGKSIQLKATMESEYGTLSDKRVAWSINAPSGSGVKISSSGKVTASSKAKSGQTYTVTAKARDGSGVSASYVVKVVNKATYISVRGLDSGGRTINEFPQYPDVNGIQQFSQHRIYSDIAGGYVQASTSNKKVVEVTTAQGYLLLTPRKAGTATITLKATDGSGVKVRYRIRVTDAIYDSK